MNDVLSECLAKLEQSNIRRASVDVVTRDLDVAGKSLINIGSGECWEAPLYLQAGARSLTCVDKFVNPGSRQLRDASAAGNFGSLEMPITVAEYFALQDGIELIAERVEDYHPGKQFDAAFLLTVTEHLTDPVAAVEAIARLVRPGGEVYLTHGNFYAWAGHHLAPYTPTTYDPNDLGQAELVDWGHVLRKDTFDSKYIELNLIRMHELAALLNRHFDARLVTCHHCPDEVRARMTPERRLELVEYHDDELFTDTWAYRGERRQAGQSAVAALPDIIPIKPRDDGYHEGHCYLVPLPAKVTPEEWRLFEDGTELPLGQQKHDDIRKDGDGRWSIWGRTLYFAPTGRSKPSAHTYEVRRVA